MNMLRCLVPAFVLLAVLASPAVRAAGEAERFPNRTVTIVVPVSAGGSSDKLTRTLADKLGAIWGVRVTVENVPGASGTIGTARVAKAAPDGYTLLQQGEGIALTSILVPNLPYDGPAAFSGIVKAVVNPQVLVVNPKTGIRDFRDYLDRAKRHPESISLGLPVNGGIAHVAHEIIARETGAKVNYIPYPGGGPAAVDVIAGHTDATLITLAAVTEYVKAGRLRALAVTTPYRSAALPDVPTMAEAGIPGFAVESWQGYFAPAGTPRAIVEKLNRDFRAALDSPEVRAKLETLGFRIAGGSAADLDATVRVEYPKYAAVIREAGITTR